LFEEYDVIPAGSPAQKKWLKEHDDKVPTDYTLIDRQAQSMRLYEGMWWDIRNGQGNITQAEKEEHMKVLARIAVEEASDDIKEPTKEGQEIASEKERFQAMSDAAGGDWIPTGVPKTMEDGTRFQAWFKDGEATWRPWPVARGGYGYPFPGAQRGKEGYIGGWPMGQTDKRQE
jgi:hypothetical protein